MFFVMQFHASNNYQIKLFLINNPRDVDVTTTVSDNHSSLNQNTTTKYFIHSLKALKTTQTTSNPLQKQKLLPAIIYDLRLEILNQYHAQEMKLSLIIVG